MRIAIVASPVAPLRPAQTGGAQSVVCDLALGLSGRGHSVTLFCAEGSQVAGVRLATVPAPADASTALVMPGAPSPPRAPGVDAALAAMFERIRAGGFDVVSQHAFDAAAFHLSSDLPVLHTLHLPPLVEAVVRAAAAVDPARLATVSRSCAAAWLAAGVDVREVLFNGVAASDEPGLRAEQVALVAGRISPEKGIDHAIAAARASGLPLRLAGAHYDPAYAIEMPGVERLGALTRDELRQVMARSAVTVCAIRWDEPFGMVAAEAQMAGCPVAGYRRGALPEVVEEGVSGYLATPDDVEDLGRAITCCLSLDRAAVIASARARLGLDAALDRYEQALRRIAA